MARGMFHRPKDSPFVTMTVAERAIVPVLLIVIWGAVGMAHAQTGNQTLLPVYLAFTAYLMALALPFMVPGFRPGFFHPLVFYVLWVGVRELLTGQAALAATGLDTHLSVLVLGRDLNSALAMSFMLEAVALLALYVGYAIAPRLRLPEFKPFATHGMAWQSLFWIGISAVGVFMVLRHAGSMESMLMQRGLAREERPLAGIGGHWAWLAGFATVVPLFWLACDGKAYKKSLFWAVVATAMAFKFLTTGSRGGTVSVLIFILVVWSLQNRRIPYLSVLVGAFVVLVAVGFAGEFRHATQKSSGKLLDDISLQGGFTDWAAAALGELGNLSGENSGQIAILTIVPDKVPYLWGESYASLPFIFIPSAIWGSKPVAGGRLVADRIYNRGDTTIPAGAVGEAYWNFSYAGVLFVFMGFGMLLKFSGDLYKRNPENPLVIILFIYTVMILSPQTEKAYDFAHQMVPVVLIYWISRRKISTSRRVSFEHGK